MIFKKKAAFVYIIIISIFTASGCRLSSPDPSALLSLITDEITGGGSGDDTVPSVSNPLVRQTRFGLVEGTEDAMDTWVWKGIPFAKPPVGDLRWRSPRDPEAWSGVRNAGEFCSYCVQYGNFISDTGRESYGKTWGDGRMVGSEDCLYLNIWRPQTKEEKLPVYVFIYGGGNILGRSDLSIYDGAHFSSKENMIVVNLNYRLGFFGWFHHPAMAVGDPIEDSGNYGTLDIIKALKWIKENIAAFGGDPDNVTIAGQSAGAFNVMSLLVSPLAEGLFHKAVMHSGWDSSCDLATANLYASNIIDRLLIQDNYADNYVAAELYRKNLKEKLGESAYHKWIRDYLRSRRPEDFYVPSNGGPLAMPLESLATVAATMGIYVDGYVVPAVPYDKFFLGTYHRVPLLFGCMSEELKLFLPFVITDDLKRFSDAAYNFDPNNPDLAYEDLLGPLSFTRSTIYSVAVPVGQMLFQGMGADPMARAFSAFQKDIYVYKFMWKDEPEPFDELIGAAHAMDLPFAFGNFPEDRDGMTYFAWSKANEEGRLSLSHAYMTYLGQFARTGNPNGGDPALPEWKPWTKGDGQPKRLLLDKDRIEMSDDVIEEEEVAGMNPSIAEVWTFIMKTLGIYYQ